MSAARARHELLVAAALLAAPAGAATIVVTAATDDFVANANCTLREALSAAIADQPRDACPAGSPTEVDEILMPRAGYVWLLGEVYAPATAFVLRGPAAAPHSSLTIQATSRFLRIYGGSTVTIENLDLAGGDATLDGARPYGGAVTVEGGSLALRGVRFAGGFARGGGALSYEGGAGQFLSIEDGAFYGAVAETGASGPAEAQGGALRIALTGDARAEILDTVFLDNEARGSAAAPAARGGALHALLGDDAELTVRQSGFGDNRVLAATAAAGGALYVLADGDSRLDLVDSIVNGNSALGGDGEGVALAARGTSSLRFERAEVAFNGAGASGNQVGVLAVEEAQVVAADLVVSAGAATGVEARSAGTASLRLGHLTITGNGTVGFDQLATEGGLLRLENSIVWGNPTDVVGPPGTIDPSCLVGVDPRFVDAAGYDYRLAADSPAIDFGDRALLSVGPYDALHGPRVVGPETDAGAHERGAVFGDGFESGDSGGWTETVR